MPSVRELQRRTVPKRVNIFVVTHGLAILLEIKNLQLIRIRNSQMQSRRMERKARRSFSLTFWGLHCPFLIIPDFYCLVFTGSRNQGLPDAHIHSNHLGRVVMQIDLFQCKLDGVLVVFVLDLDCHEQFV